MKSNMTNHARLDRMERFIKIVDTVGIGEVVEQFPESKDRKGVPYITSTGVLIIKDAKTHKIVTAYIPSVKQVLELYRRCGRKAHKEVVRNVRKAQTAFGIA